jgi:hypothetical protein
VGQQHLDIPDKRAYCRANGHLFQFDGEEQGQYPDGTPSTYEVYVCQVCNKVKYEPVPD